MKQDGGQQRTLCQTSKGAKQEGENRMRLQAVLPTEQREWERGNWREERSAVLSEWSRIGLLRRQHPGEKAVLSESVGEKT